MRKFLFLAIVLCFVLSGFAQRPARGPVSEKQYTPKELGYKLVWKDNFNGTKLNPKLGTDIVSHNVHWAYGPNQQTTRGMQSYLKGVSEGFHTFALEWTPEKYIFYIDGYKFQI